ncbi:hypothetical protein [Brevibacillus reuszeri]|uniref:hypothetical protein n=1 Tax=Brevibacillus reuszeri TaxID=54915 RepID=UPI000CCC30DC|nr:hypothetical protein [Brevibacillus reuszeri]
MQKRVGKRKVRVDKKKQLRPWLPGTLLAEIKNLYKFLNYQSRSSLMEKILMVTIQDRKFIEYVKPYMVRTIRLPVGHDDSYFVTLFGSPQISHTANQLYTEIKLGVTLRASLYITKEVAERYMHPFTSGLDISYDALATLALDFGVRNLMDKFAPGYRYKYIYKKSQRVDQRSS